MNFSAEELRKLAPALAILVALLAAGGGLIFWTQQEQRAAAQQLVASRTERVQARERLTRIRTSRELLDLRYTVERQRNLLSVAGKPANVDFFASTMKVDIALLHEGDLLAFLRDLRESGNAFYAIKRCQITRTGTAATGASIVPRLRADCDIDLITILDRAAKA